MYSLNHIFGSSQTGRLNSQPIMASVVQPTQFVRPREPLIKKLKPVEGEKRTFIRNTPFKNPKTVFRTIEAHAETGLTIMRARESEDELKRAIYALNQLDLMITTFRDRANVCDWLMNVKIEYGSLWRDLIDVTGHCVDDIYDDVDLKHEDDEDCECKDCCYVEAPPRDQLAGWLTELRTLLYAESKRGVFMKGRFKFISPFTSYLCNYYYDEGVVVVKN